MRNLLSANFLRLKKNALFWTLLAVSFGFGAFTVYTLVSDKVKYHMAVQLDSILFFYTMVIGLFSAVFISLFFGTDYSEGAIRNKVAASHGRARIYFVNLLSGYVVCLLSTLSTLLAVLILGIPTIGNPAAPVSVIVPNLLGSLLMEAALCALFTAVTMNCSKKSATAVICVLLFFLLMAGSTVVQARLEAPEFVTGYELSVNGEIAQSEPEPNPRFLQGVERAAYEFAYDLIPTGQASQYAMMSLRHPVRAAVCAAALTAAFTGAGLALFRRKDLK